GSASPGWPVTANQPHRVVGPEVGVGTMPMDRDDAGVLEPADDLGLQQETLPARGIVGVMGEKLPESPLAVQFEIDRHEHETQAAAGMWPPDAEPLAIAGRRADGMAGSAVVVAVAVLGRPVAGRHVGESGVKVKVAQPGQALLRGLA